MQNMKPFIKRLVAYTIDTVIILVVSSLLSSIPFLNKGMDNYQKTYKEYEQEYNKYSEYLKLFNDSYKDEEISEEEYVKLTENQDYKKTIETKYEDKKISQDEYDDIVEEINEEFDLIAKDYVYILSKKGISNSVITLVCTLLYFGVIQYFLKGETVGKKIFKLKVVSANNKKLNIFNYLLRSLIVNDVLLNTINILFLMFATKTIYSQVNTIITSSISVIEGIIIFLVLTREDGRGLHDLLFNTKVISTEEKQENQKIIEAKIEEKEVKNVKSKRKK